MAWWPHPLKEATPPEARLVNQETKGQWGESEGSGSPSLQWSSRKEGDWLQKREERRRSVKEK